MVRFIQQYPEHIREYLSNHLIDANENEFDCLKATIIASHSGIAIYNGLDYFCGLSVLTLMGCTALTKIPNYHKPITF